MEGLAERELQSLHDTVYDQALVWVNSLKTEQKERIEGHFGPMPQKDSELQVHTLHKVDYLSFFQMCLMFLLKLHFHIMRTGKS